MRMDLIQPFINAADAVFAESLQGPTKIGDLTMDEDAYRRKGVAALIAIQGRYRRPHYSRHCPGSCRESCKPFSQGKKLSPASRLSVKPYASSPTWSSEIPSRF